MKILLATHQYFPDYVGGTEVFTHGLARRLKERGDEVAIVSYLESPSPSQQDYGIIATEYEGVSVYTIAYNLSVDPLPVRAEYNNAFVADKFRELIRLINPELVHFTHAMKISGSTLEACYQAGIPYIVTLTDFWFLCPRHTLLKWDGSLCRGARDKSYCIKCLHQTHGFFSPKVMSMPSWMLELATTPLLQWSMRKLGVPGDINEEVWNRGQYLKEQLLRAREIFTLSGFQRDMFIRNGFPADRIRVMQHGLEDPQHYPGKETRTKNAITLLMVGSIVHHKGVHIVMEALAKSKNAELRLLVYGDAGGNDPYRKKILAQAAADGRIEMMGTVPEEQLGDVFRKADVFLMPALWYENEPLVMKAALVTGTPILASNIGSLPEMMKEGKNGELLPPGDVQAWTRAFDELSRHKLEQFKPGPSRVRSMDENFEEIYTFYRNNIQ